MKILKCFSIKKCSLCEKYKFRIYEIPIYNDLHHLYCSMTEETYATCINCIIKLVQKHNIIISLKSIIKDCVINNIIKSDLSGKSQKKIEYLQKILIDEKEFHNYMEFLTNEERKNFKEIKNKINVNFMC